MDFEIDLDSECVWLDDAWLNRDDLVRKIRTMMDSQNFEIGRPSQALESLTRSLANARLLALRISPEMSDALNAAAQHSGRPVGAVAREAISNWLSSAGAASAASASASSPTPPHLPAPPPAASAASAATTAETSSTVIVSPTVVSEPVSPEEAANAVALTPKRKEGEKDVEKRWFDK